jgi:fatty acid desaturase
MTMSDAAFCAGDSPARHAAARAKVALVLADQLPRLRRFDVRKRLVELTLFCGILLCGVTLTLAGYRSPAGSARYLLLAAGIILTALAINSLVLLLHEGMHQTLFADPGWNRWVSVLLGATFLMSFSAYQVMHIRHHRFLGDPRDPDDYHNYTKHRSLVWALHFVRLTVGSLLYVFVIPVLAFRYGSGAERRRIATEYVLLGAIYAVVASTVPAGVLQYAWLAPLLLVGQMTAIRGFTQHGITDATDPFIASRSIRAPGIVRFFLLNENYHLEHHLFPEVPSYHLKHLHELIWPNLPYAVTGRSYLGFLYKFFRATARMDETPIGFIEPAARERRSERSANR